MATSTSAAGATVVLSHRATRLIWCGAEWGWQQSSLTAVTFPSEAAARDYARAHGLEAETLPAPPSGHLWVPESVARCETCGRTLRCCEGHDEDPRR